MTRREPSTPWAKLREGAREHVLHEPALTSINQVLRDVTLQHRVGSGQPQFYARLVDHQLPQAVPELFAHALPSPIPALGAASDAPGG